MRTKAELRAAIKSMTASAFCQEVLFSDEAWLFENGGEFGIKGTYTDFRKQLGKSLGVPAKDIAIVGSAKVGFSLSPSTDKPFLSQFSENSDVDTVIVSFELFRDIWTQLKAAFYNGYSDMLDRHGVEVFKGFIVLGNSQNYNSAFLRKVSKQMMTVRRDLQGSLRLDNPIKYRIYYDWEDANNYHIWSADRLRRRLFP